MSEIKVCIKIRPVGELKKEEERMMATDSDSLECSNFLQNCNFQFDHVFDTKCDNGKVYSSIVEPIVDSCINGYDGTILTYGATSTGKNHTMMGTVMDPGIVLYAVEYLFNKISQTDKIRVAIVEIIEEKIYNLLNDRKQIMIDPNRKIDRILSDEEVSIDNIAQMADILDSGNCQRKSSPNHKNKLSHAVYRITIESDDKAGGTILKTCLQFVHVSSCEPFTGTHPSDSLLDKGDESDKSWLWVNFVMNELSEGKMDVDFLNSALTTILQEPLTSSNVAIICNIKAKAVAENVSTLEFANRAKSVRTKPVRNRMFTDQARFRDSSDDSKVNTLDHQLKAGVDVKVENLLLRAELDEVKAASEAKIKWFEGQTVAAEFDKQKLEMTRIEEKKSFVKKRHELEMQIKTLSASNRELSAKVETLQKKDVDSASVILTQEESLNRLKKEIYELKREISELKWESDPREEENGLAANVETDIKRKIDHVGDVWTNSNKILRSYFNCKIEQREIEPSAQWSASKKSDASKKDDVTDVSHTMVVSNRLIGCLIGVGGTIMASICATSGARMKFSKNDRTKNCDRFITVSGSATSVATAVDMIKQRVKTRKEELQRNPDGRRSEKL